MTKIDDASLKVEAAPVRVSRVFAAPRETVFKAWSSADHIKRWFCPDGYLVPEAKVEMRVGQVKTAERIIGADKLLKLTVDIGNEVRQICAGIAQFYEPESLIGRKVVVVVNLAPRKLRGVESNGMIVAASVGPDGHPVLAGFHEDVEVGSRLK